MTHWWYNIETCEKEVVVLKKFLLICLCVLLALALLAGGAAGYCWYIWTENVYSLELSLLGDSEITLEYGSDFTDPGADAVFYGTKLDTEPVPVSVRVEGLVDTGKVGTYTLIYRADYTADYRVVSKELSATARRTVRIVDTQAPSITLDTIDGHFTFPNEAYSEEGFSAWDDYDGDITHLVQRKEENGVVTYTVADSSGNRAEASREILYDDPVAPVITLVGGPELDVQRGEVFTDPGYTALDNCDGDLTAAVTVSGDVNMEKAGVYKLTYSVTDSYGNSCTAERVVTVFKNLKDVTVTIPDPPLEPTGKTIYLTFDDGPGKYTDRLLDILAKYNVKATFFVTYNGNPDLITRMANEGHVVAMHTASHDYYSIYASEEAYLNDLYSIQSLIRAKTGQNCTLFRFPGGSGNTVSNYNPGIMTRLTQLLTDMGYTYFDWNVDSGDAVGAGSAKEILYNVVSGVEGRQTSVVLQHDIYEASVEATELIIQWALANGYTFKTLSSNGPVIHHNVRN